MMQVANPDSLQSCTQICAQIARRFEGRCIHVHVHLYIQTCAQTRARTIACRYKHPDMRTDTLSFKNFGCMSFMRSCIIKVLCLHLWGLNLGLLSGVFVLCSEHWV